MVIKSGENFEKQKAKQNTKTRIWNTENNKTIVTPEIFHAIGIA